MMLVVVELLIQLYIAITSAELSQSRVAGTMVVHLFSVRVIAGSNPSQIPPLLMHVGK